MSLESKSVDELRSLEYRKRLVVNRLQGDLYAESDPTLVAEIEAELNDAEDDLLAIEIALADAEAKVNVPEPTREEVTEGGESPEPASRQDVGRYPRRRTSGEPRYDRITRSSRTVRGLETTGLEVTVNGFMEHLPTAFYHLLEREQNPLVSYTVTTNSNKTRRLRVISFIEEYTAQAVDTIEVKRGDPQTVRQLPTLFPEKVRNLSELTRATLNIRAEDLENGKTEEHKTESIWLLARTTAPRHVRDAVSGETIDLSRYLAAFVTPNEPSVMRFQRRVVEQHHEGRLKGYRGDVESQAAAIYNALKEDLDIKYVHSRVSFNLEDGARSQRIRLPRECIDGEMANCIDASLLFASLLEGISLNPVIALVPGHVFVGWQKAEDVDDWAYLETTMLQTNTFREALDVGTARAASYRKKFDATGNPAWFQALIISELRTKDGITPME